VSISVVKCTLVKCNEVLQCNDRTSNKVSNIIRRHLDYHILSYSLGSFFLNQYLVLFLFITVIYVFLL
jgi:hypothetical protein